MLKRHFILATAGHVDHGKSSLVKALTGTDPDRLPEEKARGITIDLGFAHLELIDGKGATYSVGIVDVPGHEDFIKNMVSGVGGIDVALLVVAADDGWMPQTEEHLQILEYLGVRHAVVALTKIDIGNCRPDEIRQRLDGSVFRDAAVVPVSSATNEGLDHLKQTLLEVFSKSPSPRNIGKPRLPVDRIFSLRGVGAVVTGTLIGGELGVGENVVLQPGERKSRIRTLQNHNAEVQRAFPGMRTAINLPDVAGKGIERGDVVTVQGLGASSRAIDALIHVTPRKSLLKNASTTLKAGVQVRVHQGSSNHAAKIIFSEDRKQLGQGESSVAQLRFESPVFMFIGDRFIVRDWPEQNTLGGGLVLHVPADPRRWRKPDYQDLLQRRALSPTEPAVFVETELVLHNVVSAGELLRQSRFSTEEINDTVQSLVRDRIILKVGTYFVLLAWWDKHLNAAMESVTAWHRSQPQKQGLPVNDLRASLADLPPHLFEPLLHHLGARGYVQEGTIVRARAHRLSLPDSLQAAGEKVRGTLTAKGLEPPSRKELAADKSTQGALKFLIESGEAVEIGLEIVLLKATFEGAKQVIIRHLAQHQAATVSELKQALGSSRRIVVPLLEKLDKEGVTLRQGDKRVLKKP